MEKQRQDRRAKEGILARASRRATCETLLCRGDPLTWIPSAYVSTSFLLQLQHSQSLLLPCGSHSPTAIWALLDDFDSPLSLSLRHNAINLKYSNAGVTLAAERATRGAFHFPTSCCTEPAATMPPKTQQKTKEQKMAAALAGGKSKKKKWSKKANRDSAMNKVGSRSSIGRVREDPGGGSKAVPRDARDFEWPLGETYGGKMLIRSDSV
eukprot:scaffold385_cov305-Pinguiococcus_pyrenoidosus.AAC.57